MSSFQLNAALVASNAKKVRDYLAAGVLLFEGFYLAAKKVAEMSTGVTP